MVLRLHRSAKLKPDSKLSHTELAPASIWDSLVPTAYRLLPTA